MSAREDSKRLIGIWQAASIAVWNSETAWREEATSAEARVLAWPQPDEGTKHQRLMKLLFNADVDVVLVWMKAHAHPMTPAWPPDVHDPKMQVLLRVMARAGAAGEAAVLDEFGGDTVSGFGPNGAFVKQVNEQLAELALQMARDMGLIRDEAFDLVGLPRRKGFRAVKRARRRR